MTSEHIGPRVTTGNQLISPAAIAKLATGAAVQFGTADYRYTYPSPVSPIGGVYNFGSYGEAPVQTFDTIGLTWSPLLTIPAGWAWWAEISLFVDVLGAPAVGDFWLIAGINEVAAPEPLQDGQGGVSGVQASCSGYSGSVPFLTSWVITAQENNGVPFTVQSFHFSMMGIYQPTVVNAAVTI